MKAVQSITFSHMIGGHIYAISLIILFVILLIVSLVGLLRLNDFFGFFIILVVDFLVGLLAWRVTKIGFTTVTFEGNTIESKSTSDSELLDINEIKGIWYSKNYHLPNMTFIEYTPEQKIPFGSLVLIGDIDYFEGAEFLSMNGMNFALKDCFWRGYTTLQFRKALKPVLDFYYNHLNNIDNYN